MTSNKIPNGRMMMPFVRVIFKNNKNPNFATNYYKLIDGTSWHNWENIL